LIKFIDWCSNQNFRFKSFTEFSSIIIDELIALEILEFRFTWSRSMNGSRSFVLEMYTFLFLSLNRRTKRIFSYDDRLILKIYFLILMVVEIDHFRKFDFFGFIIWDVVIQIWLHHFGKQAFIFKTLQHLKEPTNFFIKVWVLMPFLWFSASLIWFYVKLHLFKLLLIIRSFHIHITLINRRIHFINA